MRQEFLFETNGKGISLICCGGTVSVRIARTRHQLIVFFRRLSSLFLLSTRTVANPDFTNHLQQIVPLLDASDRSKSERCCELFGRLHRVGETQT